MRRLFAIAAFTACGALSGPYPAAPAADRAACERSCQRDFDECRDGCPRSGPKAKTCQDACRSRYDACRAGCG